MRDRWEIIFLTALILFCGFSVFVTTSYVGIHPDEGDAAVAALDIVKQLITTEEAPSPFNRAVLKPVGSVLLPISFSEYHGAFGLYFTSFFFFISSSVFIFRFSFMLLGAGIIVSAYFLIKEIFDKPVAVLSVSFLAVNPLFTQLLLLGHRTNEVFMLFFLFFGGFLLSRFFLKGKPIFLGMSFFVFGVGFSTKHMFLGFLPGLVLGFYLLNPKQKQLFFKHAITAGLAFLAGAIGFLYDAFFGQLNFVAFLRKSLSVTENGHNNLNIWENFLGRWGHFTSMLKGDIYIALQNTEFVNIYEEKMFYLSFLFLALAFFFKLKHKLLKTKLICFLMLFYGLLFVCVLFVPLVFDGKHMLLFMLFPQTIIALGVVVLFDFLLYRFSGKFLKKGIILILACLVGVNFTIHLSNLKLQHRSFVKNKTDHRFWSFCIYEAVAFMNKQSIAKVYTVNHSLWPSSIAYLSNGKIITDNFWFSYFRAKYNNKDLSVNSWLSNIKEANDFYFLSADTKADKEVLEIWELEGRVKKEVKTFICQNEKLILWQMKGTIKN